MAAPSPGPALSDLLARLRDPRDADAWAAFVARYGPLVYHQCRRRGLQPADAEDVTQLVLVRVSRAVVRFVYDPGRGRFRDWLATVTRHRIYHFLRERAGRAGVVCGPPAEAAVRGACGLGLDPESVDEWDRRVLAAGLARAAARCDPKTWRALELAWVGGRPAPDVARELGKDVDWVYVAKSRVLTRLREEVLALAADDGGPDGPGPGVAEARPA